MAAREEPLPPLGIDGLNRGTRKPGVKKAKGSGVLGPLDVERLTEKSKSDFP